MEIPNIFLISLKSFTDTNEAIALSADGQMLAHFSPIEEKDVMYVLESRSPYHQVTKKFDQKFPKGWKAIFIPTKSFNENKDVLSALKKFVADDIDYKTDLW